MSVLINKINFDELSRLNTATRLADSASTFFLSPLRYLWKGQTVQCITLVSGHWNEFVYLNLPEKRSVLRTVVSIILVLPCSIIGTIIKTPTLACSARLRRRYAGFIPSKAMNSNLKDICDLAIVMSNASMPLTYRMSKTPRAPITYINNKDQLTKACDNLLQEIFNKGADSNEQVLANYVANRLQDCVCYQSKDDGDALMAGVIGLRLAEKPNPENVKKVANAIYTRYTGYSIDTPIEQMVSKILT